MSHKITQVQARLAAYNAVENISKTGDHVNVVDGCFVGFDSYGYWVANNGEETSGLTKLQAVDVLSENIYNDVIIAL